MAALLHPGLDAADSEARQDNLQMIRDGAGRGKRDDLTYISPAVTDLNPHNFPGFLARHHERTISASTGPMQRNCVAMLRALNDPTSSTIPE